MKDFNYTQFIKAHGEEALPSYLARVLRKLTGLPTPLSFFILFFPHSSLDRQNVGIATMAHALQGGQSALDLPTFLSIGNGSLGGKGRSLGFFNSVLLRNGIPSLLDEFNVKGYHFFLILRHYLYFYNNLPSLFSPYSSNFGDYHLCLQ